MKIDTNLSTTAANATTNTSKTHGNNTTDHDGYMYLDEMLDKTFITDYFLQ